MNNKMLGGILTGVIVVGGIFGGIAALEKIPAGYVGIVYNAKGGIEDKVLPQGWHFLAPWKKVTEYSVATEQGVLAKDKEDEDNDESFLVPTKDGKGVVVDLEFSYRFDVDKVDELFTKFRGQDGEDIANSYIKMKMKAWSGEVTSKFSVLEIYGEKRAELNQQVYNHVKDKFAKDGIIIESTNFSRIGLDKATEKAIQSRVNAQQQLEKEKIELDKAKIQADKLRVQAQGKADANDILQQSITPELIEFKKIEKWNGVDAPGGTPIIDMRK
jgi:regulator of protease activity HflC (stomatin/prohibitin superfamily)